ncbi:unnamed protein product [Pleuronectes platessa]|uniref:Uncharacterized protein n=1 Tax=Pleuronectes platessa TaxID=8262 RepID=A0A9N7TRF2_PLEPL|nr:unnamed protein product [Pleuronectes platessa]
MGRNLTSEVVSGREEERGTKRRRAAERAEIRHADDCGEKERGAADDERTRDIGSDRVFVSSGRIFSSTHLFSNHPAHPKRHPGLHRCTKGVLMFSFIFLKLIITFLRVLCAARTVSGSYRASARNALDTILLHGVQLFICMLSFLSPFINIAPVTTWPNVHTTILFVTFLFTNVLPRLLSQRQEVQRPHQTTLLLSVLQHWRKQGGGTSEKIQTGSMVNDLEDFF